MSVRNNSQESEKDRLKSCDWIKQSEHDIADVCSGSTLLVKFNKNWLGITIGSGETVDISWLRDPAKGTIFGTEGEYSKDDIKEYKVIE